MTLESLFGMDSALDALESIITDMVMCEQSGFDSGRPIHALVQRTGGEERA